MATVMVHILRSVLLGMVVPMLANNNIAPGIYNSQDRRHVANLNPRISCTPKSINNIIA